MEKGVSAGGNRPRAQGQHPVAPGDAACAAVSTRSRTATCKAWKNKRGKRSLLPLARFKVYSFFCLYRRWQADMHSEDVTDMQECLARTRCMCA